TLLLASSRGFWSGALSLRCTVAETRSLRRVKSLPSRDALPSGPSRRTASGHRVCPGSIIPNAVQELLKRLKRHADAFHADFGNERPLVERYGSTLGRVSLDLSRLPDVSIRHADRRMVKRSS